jgi:hypothetical protein
MTGAVLGIILGLAIAVVLQQEGIWPLDQLTVFLLPALLGLLFLFLLTVGRAGDGRIMLIIALLILVPMAVWGALGLGKTNQQGQLNGGCVVFATSSAPDETMVTDSFKQDPFQIDPQGSLHWEAASPTIFMDYDWEMWVEIGGIAVPFDSDHEGNEGGSPANEGDVGNIEAYADSKGVDLDQLRGVFMVGGFASTCDGFGFVVLTTSSVFQTLASKIALALIILIIIIMIILIARGRRGGVVDSVSTQEVPEGTTPDDGPIFTDGFESGDTSAWTDD